MKKTIILSFILTALAGLASAQSPVGQWKTIDDETGKEKSIVEIFEKNGKLFGKVVKLIDSEEENPKCNECEEDDDRYNQPVIGMEIIRDLEQDGEEWEDGTVMDPENGKIYSCKIWLEDEKTLKLRGYIAFFYRTQTWYRVE